MELKTREDLRSTIEHNTSLLSVDGLRLRAQTLHNYNIETHQYEPVVHYRVENPSGSRSYFNTSTVNYLSGFSQTYQGASIFKMLPSGIRKHSVDMTKYSNSQREFKQALIDDFFYYWIIGFGAVTIGTVQERLAKFETAISPATVAMVNLLLSSGHNPKTLFKGGAVSWKLRGGMWVPTAYYSYNAVYGYALFTKVNYRFMRSSDTDDNGVRYEFIPLKLVLGIFIEGTQAQNPRQLASHSTRATDYFQYKQEPKKMHSTFLGVELELENYDEGSYEALDKLNTHAIFKRDGSLSRGVEICTAPATLGVHKEAFVEFFKANTQLAAHSTCGMHVHVDKRSLTKLHVANIHMFMNNDDNESKIQTIAGREPNSYCGKAKLEYYDFTSKTIPSSNRYQRINHSNSNTIEFRLFASTTKYDEFCTRLEFTQAVVDYTRPAAVNISIKNLYKWDNFEQYVQNHRGLYPMLAKQLKETSNAV